MMQKTKQLRGFVEKLEQTAIELKLQRRILDSIAGIKQGLQNSSKKTQIDDSIQELDDLMSYLRKRAAPEGTMPMSEDGAVAVSETEVQKKIQTLLENCAAANHLIRNKYAGGQNTYIDEVERAMHELSNVDVMYDLVTVPAQFTGRMNQIGQTYDQRIMENVKEYIQEAGTNFDQAMQKIKRMLESIGYQKNGLSQSEIYQKWDAQLERIHQNQIESAKQTEKGGQVLSQFGVKHAEPIQKIIRKKKRKAAWYRLFPILIPLLLIGVISLAQLGFRKLEQEIIQTETAEQTKQDTNAYVESLLEEILQPEILQQEMEDTFVNPPLKIIIILLIVWYLWIRFVNKMCKRWICDSLGLYLTKEIGQFWEDHTLQTALEKGMTQIEANVEAQYQQLMATIFQGMSQQQQENGVQMQLLELCAQWDMIKYQQ